MNKATIEVLKKLYQFCVENNCSFVRSANSTNDLVLSVKTGPKEFEYVYFEEEICEESIRNEWFTV